MSGWWIKPNFIKWNKHCPRRVGAQPINFQVCVFGFPRWLGFIIVSVVRGPKSSKQESGKKAGKLQASTAKRRITTTAPGGIRPLCWNEILHLGNCPPRSTLGVKELAKDSEADAGRAHGHSGFEVFGPLVQGLDCSSHSIEHCHQIHHRGAFRPIYLPRVGFINGQLNTHICMYQYVFVYTHAHVYAFV